MKASTKIGKPVKELFQHYRWSIGGLDSGGCRERVGSGQILWIYFESKPEALLMFGVWEYVACGQGWEDE